MSLLPSSSFVHCMVQLLSSAVTKEKSPRRIFVTAWKGFHLHIYCLQFLARSFEAAGGVLRYCHLQFLFDLRFFKRCTTWSSRVPRALQRVFLFLFFVATFLIALPLFDYFFFFPLVLTFLYRCVSSSDPHWWHTFWLFKGNATCVRDACAERRSNSSMKNNNNHYSEALEKKWPLEALRRWLHTSR